MITSSRRSTARAAAMLLLTVPLAACGSASGSEDREVGGSLDEIVELAQEEGRVHLIAYPETWANYGETFEDFTAEYGIEVEVSSPNASSAEELVAVANLQGQESQPDVMDIGYSFTRPAIDQGLLDTYVPTLAGEVPEALKDPDGRWVGAYYGVLSIGVDANQVPVPTSFADLTGPDYCGRITIGDPREGASNLAAVFAAALAGGGGLDDVQPGIDFFAQLADAGCLVPTSSTAAALTTGEAAVTFDWNYNYSGIAEEVAASGVDLQTAVPADGVFGNYYAQPVTVSSPQPNAARLWVEWLLSDEGAINYAESGAVPARFEAMSAAGTIPPDVLASLPPAEVLEQITFPTLDQGEAATGLVVDQWGPEVASR